ncbi:MAG TPA: undecaprenyl-diphosphate phosphatase [Terriglobales bacterium]|nr:undecaprenyl-diphosphate phosphatase [Terriglobales bacterium]
MILLKALLLGVVEGITEFLPISSTGHLILVSRYLDYPERMRATFEIFIQLGAILAVIWHFQGPMKELVREARTRPDARDLLAKVALAFIPAAVAGLLFGSAIQAFLFSPRVVGMSLLLGGIVIIVIERFVWLGAVRRIEDTSWRAALFIGLAQVLSLVPGVSRAAATIIGGLVSGLSRPVAAVFSFYLSVPTIMAASLYSLFKARHLLEWSDVPPLAVGFGAAFVSALIVIRAFLSYVQRHDSTAFGIYRIILGLAVLALV